MSEGKDTKGKLKISLVPMEILKAIAVVREYGNKKYKSTENWKTVDPQEYRDAMLRHIIEYNENPYGCASDSGIPHLWHIACNIAFICYLEQNKLNQSWKENGGQENGIIEQVNNRHRTSLGEIVRDILR